MKESFNGRYIELDFSENLSLKPKFEIQAAHFSGRQYTLGILIFADTNFRGFRGFWPNSRKLISAKYFRWYDSRK